MPASKSKPRYGKLLFPSTRENFIAEYIEADISSSDPPIHYHT